MKIEEPKYRFSDKWEELAALFNYQIISKSQDWTYEVEEPERIDEYLAAYDNTIKNEDSKFGRSK